MYISMNKQLVSFQDFFGVLFPLSQGKGLKTLSHFRCLPGSKGWAGLLQNYSYDSICISLYQSLWSILLDLYIMNQQDALFAIYLFQ
jgi:hypothetical protein